MFEKMRERWTKAINPLVHRMEGVDPSFLTWTSLVLSILAFYLLMTAGNDTNGAILIIAGVIVILIAGVLDGLDGALARHQGTDGPYGDFLDHTIDRIVDVGILVAIGMNAAPALAGQSMGLIDEIKGVEEIINETILQFNEVCKKMGNHNFAN